MSKKIEENELYILRSGQKRRAKEYVCPICNKKFIRANSDIKGKKPFCSRKCFQKSQRKRFVLSCDFCGKKLERVKSKMRSKSGLYFCSISCRNEAQKMANGIMKPNHYKNGEHIDYRKRAFEIYEKKCSNCAYNEFEEGLDVHHVDGNRKNNNDDNLLVLCGTCHILVERKIFKVDNRKLKRT